MLFPAFAISKKAFTMPVTVPKKPSIGPRDATVATSETRFSRLATSSFPAFSTAVWMSGNGRPKRERPLSIIRAMGESVDFAS